MRPGKLERLAQRERKTKSVYQAEAECNHPSSPEGAGSSDVFQCHVNDGSGNERFDERRKPERIRSEIVSRSDQCDGMRHGKRGDDRDERAKPAERDDQAKEEKEMVSAVEDVKKSQIHKAQSRLVPSRIEPDETRVAVQFESADRTTGGKEAKNRDDAQTQARKPRLDGETRAIRLNGSVKQNVQHGLVPSHIRGIG